MNPNRPWLSYSLLDNDISGSMSNTEPDNYGVHGAFAHDGNGMRLEPVHCTQPEPEYAGQAWYHDNHVRLASINSFPLRDPSSSRSASFEKASCSPSLTLRRFQSTGPQFAFSSMEIYHHISLTPESPIPERLNFQWFQDDSFREVDRMEGLESARNTSMIDSQNSEWRFAVINPDNHHDFHQFRASPTDRSPSVNHLSIHSADCMDHVMSSMHIHDNVSVQPSNLDLTFDLNLDTIIPTRATSNGVTIPTLFPVQPFTTFAEPIIATTALTAVAGYQPNHIYGSNHETSGPSP